ncbi:MAG: type II toxin-antitoxin system VapC family toxin [Nitrospirae bacterium]|nr:type II toxin-antitoxin system VapC family toxin [Nitrospirota bacterium]
MALLIADTDVLIDFLAGHNPTADRIALHLEEGTLCTTTVTRFELLSGARTATQERRIRQLLEALPTLPLDDAAADQAAHVRQTMERNGTSIGMGDSLIAGIVLCHRGILLTRNRRHFEIVPGLNLAD